MSDRQISSGKDLSIIKKQREVGGRSGIANRAWQGLVRIACITAVYGAASVALGQVQEEWVARYNGPPGNGSDSAYALAVDGAGNVYVTGESAGSGTGRDYATVKYDADGTLLWVRRYNGPGNAWDAAVAIALDPEGNVYVTGRSQDSGAGGTPLADYATLKYDTDGNLLWLARYEGPTGSGNYARALAVDGAGNVYVTGRSWGGAGTYSDYATLKYDTDGNLLWERRYNGPANRTDQGNAIALDDAGNVYVTGESRGVGTLRDFATVKYDTNGNELWVRRYNGPANRTDQGNAIALDDAGNVYVIGNSWGSGTDYDYATLKYDTDGNQLWIRRYNGPGNGVDVVRAVGVDAAGNVYVTGGSVGLGTDFDWATIKYDGNGQELWVLRYNGPANSVDASSALVIDKEGNVYVAGLVWNWGTDYDYLTFKYDVEGNELWSISYNGPANERDYGGWLALGSGGNVYVLGQSQGSSTDWDYATIKYSQYTTVSPDSFSLFRGILTGGGLSDLLASDDSWMTVRPGITLNQSERQVQLIIEGTAPTGTPSELRFRVEAHADINNIGQWIDLWNYDTSSWEEVDFMIATLADSIVEVSITTNPERFIQAGTKEMKAKISYKEAGIVLFFPWLISFDQTAWVIVP